MRCCCIGLHVVHWSGHVVAATHATAHVAPHPAAATAASCQVTVQLLFILF
jgi:hypothetical protein